MLIFLPNPCFLRSYHTYKCALLCFYLFIAFHYTTLLHTSTHSVQDLDWIRSGETIFKCISSPAPSLPYHCSNIKSKAGEPCRGLHQNLELIFILNWVLVEILWALCKSQTVPVLTGIKVRFSVGARHSTDL